jgi:hypothetical protein
MFKSMIAFIFLCLSAMSASAMTLNYVYQGQELTCPASLPNCFGGGETFTGSLTIDEDALPVLGGIANATLALKESGGTFSYTLTTPTSTLSSTYSPPGGTPFFFETGGIVNDILQGSIAEASYTFMFDGAKQIVGWAGDCLCGGSNDLFSSTSGDGTADGASAGPGTWTLAPAVVPLPAPVFLLMAGLFALRLPRAFRRA